MSNTQTLADNKLATMPVPKLIRSLGLPMVISMLLLSVYNVVDSIFVINMGEGGNAANLALTYAFPIQQLILSVSVGTGIGINSLLSKELGEGDQHSINRVVGNGIFLVFCIYICFLLFGIFGAHAFITMQANSLTDELLLEYMTTKEEVITMGTQYLTICCCFSIGSIGYSIAERFLQSTGRTLFSTFAQITGSVLNIILDYVFIYIVKMGVPGAALATVISEIVAMSLALIFHFVLNKEIQTHIRYCIPRPKVISQIYQIGFSAAIMQALMPIMNVTVNLVLGTAQPNLVALLQGSYGIYFKIMSFGLTACFGLSNAMITATAFNYGAKHKERTKQCFKYGAIYGMGLTFIISIFYQVFASPMASLLNGGDASLESTVAIAMHIASIGYIFMGFTINMQGILQALRQPIYPLILASLRFLLLVLPLMYLFSRGDNAATTIWLTFPIAELLTAIIAAFIMRYIYKQQVISMED